MAGASSRSAECARRLVVIALPISSIVALAVVAGAWLVVIGTSPGRRARRRTAAGGWRRDHGCAAGARSEALAPRPARRPPEDRRMAGPSDLLRSTCLMAVGQFLVPVPE